MWWAPENDSERALKALLERIETLFLRSSEGGEESVRGVVHGIGSALGPDGEWLPLIVVDERFGPDRYRSRLRWRWMERLLNRLRGARSLDPEYKSLEHLDDHIRQLLRDWELPGNTVVMFAEAPRAAVEASSLVWSAGKVASLGVFLMRDDGRVMGTTAGHLVHTVPATISLRFNRLYRVDMERIGQVLIANDPTSVAGVDVALIELEQPVDLKLNAAAVADPEAVKRSRKVILLGGRSGSQKGWVQGGLNLTYESGGRIWRNCWLVQEFAWGFGQDGDSGSVVIREEDGSVLGHFVGTEGVVRFSGRYQSGLVQDLSTMLAFAQDRPGCPSRALIADWHATPVRRWWNRI